MILNNVPNAVRGDLTRWLLEVKSGVYVGDVSARVREKLWERCTNSKQMGGVFQAWSVNNEQGFRMRMDGITDRRVVNWEGIELIEETNFTEKEKKEVENRQYKAEKNC